MVLVNSFLTFQGYEQKTITKGERAGQNFYIVRFISGFDTLEFMIFNDSPELLSKVLKASEFEKFSAKFGILQNSGNTRLSLIDLSPVEKAGNK